MHHLRDGELEPCPPRLGDRRLVYARVDVARTKLPEFQDAATTAVMPPKDAPKLVGAIVRVVGAPAQPAELRLRGGTCKIGSGEGNDVVVQDPTVSRKHVELTLTNDGVQLVDLGSRNGTFYLEQRVGTIMLAFGARISIGAVTLAIDPDTEGLLDGLHYDETAYRGLLGASPRMRRLFAMLQRLESSLATVLVEGESGVGKEVVARALHEGSPVRPDASSRSTAARSRGISSRASCSGTGAARSRARSTRARARSSSRTAARSSSTRSASSPRRAARAPARARARRDPGRSDKRSLGT